MKTHLLFSNNVFVNRIINVSDPIQFANQFAVNNGYRIEDIEIYEYENDDIEQMISTQNTTPNSAVIFKKTGVELTKYEETFTERKEIIKDKDGKDVDITIKEPKIDKVELNKKTGIKIK